MRRTTALLRPVVAASLALSAMSTERVASADSFSATRTDSLREREHRADIVLHRDYATVHVEREVWNDGDVSDQASFQVTPPPSGVAVALKTLGVVDGKPHWFEGDLMEAESAAAKYRELTGIGGHYPKDPALLSWMSADSLVLQVFPCPANQGKKVSYDFVVPVSYRDGKYTLNLGAMGTAELPADARISVASETSRLYVDGSAVGNGSALKLDAEHVASEAAPFKRKLEGHLASVPFGTYRNLVAFHIEAPPLLSTVPEDARIVILVDTSFSMKAAPRSSAFSAAHSYLANFADKHAKVDIVAFARRPHEVTSGFVSVEDAEATLVESAMTHDNGSEVGVALDFADELLRTKAPVGGATRILLLTDKLTREHLDIASIGATLHSNAILHIATIEIGEASIHRNDDGAWADLSRGTGGVLWEGTALPGGMGDPANDKSIFEEWARPKRIDGVHIVTAATIESVDATSLPEGTGVQQTVLSSYPAEFLNVTGELWSTPVRLELKPDQAYSKRWSAMVFGSQLVDDLNEPEMMKLAVRGGAVSPVTSYLAIEPGVRPSTDGLEQFGSGRLGISGFGRGGGGAGLRIGTVLRPTFDKHAWLKAQIAPLAQICKTPGGHAELGLESTVDEIVDVDVRAPSPTTSEGKCLVEAIWGLRLPLRFDLVSDRFDLTI